MSALVLSKENFDQEVYQSDLPVIVDFWATWCGPCNEVLPIVEALSEEFAGKVKVCKVNVDDNPELTAKFRVMTIPTLITFNKGEKLAEKVYPRNREEILALLGEEILKAL